MEHGIISEPDRERGGDAAKESGLGSDYLEEEASRQEAAPPGAAEVSIEANLSAAAPPRGVSQSAVAVAKPLSLLALFLLLPALHSHVVEPVYALLLASLVAAFYLLAPKTEAYRLWGIYIVGFMLFASIRTFADATGSPVHYAYPAEFATAIAGNTFSSLLQDAFYTPGRVGPLDAITTVVYVSYFTGHYIVGLALWRFRPAQFRTYVLAMLATFYIGLICYFLLPTAPPWLASDHGVIDTVVRIPKALSEQVASGSYEQATAVAGANDVAAMPSLHLAITLVVAIAATRALPALRWLAGAYVLAMGFSLIYLGEHYLLDLLAGAVLALVAYRIADGRLALLWRNREPPSSRSASQAP